MGKHLTGNPLGQQDRATYDQMVEAGLRLRCVVPGCRCTTKVLSPSEFMCARHWLDVDTDMRVRYSNLKRRISKTGGDKVMEVFLRHWQLIKRQAIGRTMGIRL